MLAAVYEGIGKISIKDIEKPKLSKDGMIIKVNSCAICGTDVKAFTKGISRITIPVILGHEFCGTVVEVGMEVKDFKIGDRITMATTVSCGGCLFCNTGLGNLCENVLPVGTVVNGAFCEYMGVLPLGIKRGNVLKVPDNLSDDEAAISEPLGCVINGQIQAEVSQGDTVVIIGAGPIGCLHIEAAKSRGATKIIVIQRSEFRAGLVEKFDVDKVIISSKEDPVSACLNATNGKGADVVIISAPSNEAAEYALKLIKKGGRLSLFSSFPKDNPKITIDGNLIHYKQIKVVGASDSTSYHQILALNLLSFGKINTSALITHRFPLSKFLNAIEIAKRGESLKIIIKP